MSTILFFDLFAATYLIFLGFSGFKQGLIIEIGKIIGLTLALLISFLYYIDLAEVLQQEFSINPIAVLIISFFVIFSLTLIVTRIIISLFDQIISIQKPRLFNQLSGFTFGAFKGVIIITMVLWLFEILPYQKWTDTLYDNSTIARAIRNVRDGSIKYFGWEEPIRESKEHIKDLMERSVNDQTTEE